MSRRIIALGCFVVGLTVAASTPAHAGETESAPQNDVVVHVSGPRGVVLERMEDACWVQVCTTPCAAKVARGASYRFAGKDVVPEPLVLPAAPTNEMFVRVTPQSLRGKQGLVVAGTDFAVLGGLLFVVGAVIVVANIGTPLCGGLSFGVAATSEDVDRRSQTMSSCEAHNGSLADTRDTGWVMMGAGVIAGLGGSPCSRPSGGDERRSFFASPPSRRERLRSRRSPARGRSSRFRSSRCASSVTVRERKPSGVFLRAET